MNKVKVLKEVDILLEGEIASRFYSKIRLAIEKEELEGKRSTIECLYWPKTIILRKRLSETPFKKKGMKTNVKLKKFDIYVVSKTKYNDLRKGKTKLAYTRFSNLRNYFLIKRLQALTKKEKKELKISFAIRDSKLDKTLDYSIEEKIVRELQFAEDGEWTFNGDEGFMTKVPAFFGPLLFIELSMFRGNKISITDRRKVDSNNYTDYRSISTRLVIE